MVNKIKKIFYFSFSVVVIGIIICEVYYLLSLNFLLIKFERQQASAIESLSPTSSEIVLEEVKKSEEKKAVLITVGDIMLSRGVARKIREEKNNFDYPFLNIKDFFNEADIVFGNLETPITYGREVLKNEMKFRADPGAENSLSDAGFNILSLANNHSMNFGEFGLLDTFEYLNNAGIKYVGAGKNSEEALRPVYINRNGFTFAFLAFTDSEIIPESYEATGKPGVAVMNINELETSIEEARRNSNFVIVSMHAGEEYIDYPNRKQIDFAHDAINFGADLVIGHHPHVVQPLEKYKGKYIFYSLGNFIFDQDWSEETQRGLGVKFVFNKDGIENISLIPFSMKKFSQPNFLPVDESDEVIQRLKYNFLRDSVFEK